MSTICAPSFFHLLRIYIFYGTKWKLFYSGSLEKLPISFGKVLPWRSCVAKSSCTLQREKRLRAESSWFRHQYQSLKNQGRCMLSFLRNDRDNTFIRIAISGISFDARPSTVVSVLRRQSPRVPFQSRDSAPVTCHYCFQYYSRYYS